MLIMQKKQYISVLQSLIVKCSIVEKCDLSCHLKAEVLLICGRWTGTVPGPDVMKANLPNLGPLQFLHLQYLSHWWHWEGIWPKLFPCCGWGSKLQAVE